MSCARAGAGGPGGSGTLDGPAPGGPDRRAFLGNATRSLAGAAAGSAVAGLGIGLAGCASVRWVPVAPVGGRVRIALDEYPELAGPGGALAFLPTGWDQPVYVLRDGEAFVAVSAVCTHRGCTVDIEGTQLVCPCHGSRYRRSGVVVEGPAEEDLLRFPVVQEGPGVLVVDVRGQP